MSRSIWIARHASRQDFADPKWEKTAARPYDPPLSPAGQGEARALARRLRGEPIARIFSSPFLRCVETALPVAEAIGCPIEIEQGLSEWLSRAWFPEGPPATLPVPELARLFARVDSTSQSRGTAHYGETGPDAVARAGRVARKLVDTIPGDLLLVGHGASVLGAAGGLLGANLEEDTARVSELPYACLLRLVRGNGCWRLALGPDTSHLVEGA